MIDKLDEILIEMCKGNSNCAGSDNCLNCEQSNIKQAKTAILNWVKENVVIDRDIFRSVVGEHSPSIAEDSGQPEWSQGELDKCYDELMANNPIKLKER